MDKDRFDKLVNGIHPPNTLPTEVDIDARQLETLGLFGDITSAGPFNPKPKDMKFDDGKVFAALPFQDFPNALHAVAKIGTFGAKKYARHSWKTVNDAFTRYQDAAYRHRLAIHMGETIDPESGLPHRAHLVWNELALLQLELTK